MIVYKDQTFCVSPDCNCSRKLTRRDVLESEALKLPLSLAFCCNQPEDKDARPQIPLLQGLRG